MNPTNKALLQLHTAVLLAGFTGVLGKLIQLNEAWLVWYRMLITVGVLLLMDGMRDNQFVCRHRCVGSFW